MLRGCAHGSRTARRCGMIFLSAAPAGWREALRRQLAREETDVEMSGVWLGR